ncbi:dipeptidase [soil metagenome]
MYHRALDRRHFLGGAATALALAPLGAHAAARRADHLWRDSIVIDGNLVAPFDPDAPLDAATARQIRASGLTALKMTIGGAAGSFAEAEEMIDMLDRAIAMSPSLYLKIATASDLLAAKRSRRVGIVYSFEAASMLDGKSANVAHFASRGVRVMGLSYNGTSPFASGVMSTVPAQGLTALGREAVAAMNEHGVTLDLSHSDELSSLAAVAASTRPVAITHAGCAAVHAHPRNKSDRLLRAVSDAGGVTGIYELCFISAGPRQQSIEDYMAHLLHALRVCGEDHVGIGSDALLTPFDTSPASMAEWDKDILARKAQGVAAPGEGRPPFVTGLNRADRSRVIAEQLERRGQPLRVIEKILGANFQRLFEQSWGG